MATPTRLTKSIISQLKQEHGEEVYSVTVAGADYAFRPLTVGEYGLLVAGSLSAAAAEDYAVEHAIIWPTDFKISDMMPGTITAIAGQILGASHFMDPKSSREIFNQKRAEAQSIVNTMKSVILACYQEMRMTEEDVNALTFTQLAERVAMAEQIILVRKSIFDPSLEMSLEIIDPEEQAELERLAQEEELKKTLKHNKNPDYRPSNFGAARGDDPIAAQLNAALAEAKRTGMV